MLLLSELPDGNHRTVAPSPIALQHFIHASKSDGFAVPELGPWHLWREAQLKVVVKDGEEIGASIPYSRRTPTEISRQT